MYVECHQQDFVFNRLDFLCYTLACREKMSSQAERTPSITHYADTARQFHSTHFWTISRLSARLSRHNDHNDHNDDQTTE
ncbi:hypothetical protein AL543_20705 [Vibrio mimicus]|nr:hypothetical protein AL543_20690 [Vibrio mimicus]AUW38420.1 hypothetical protein AL543_20705 [Vibrio mimicus]KAA3490971.1 hypothetical protein Y058_19235 [Vibrio mimicus]